MNLRYATLIGLSILTGGLNAACYHLQDASGPMATLRYPNEAADGGAAADLVVLLPGLGDSATAFEEEGLVAYLRGPRFVELPVDVVAVNAHFGYYRNRTAIDRLHAELIVPATEAGYQRIHLVGISLGGFGALRYLRDHPGRVASVTLLAPYVGERAYYGALREPGLLTADDASDGENPWPWIAELPPDALDRVYLGYGDRDKFAEGHAALATLLDPERVVVKPGKHRWRVWKTIWPELFEVVRLDVLGRTAEPASTVTMSTTFGDA